MTDGLTVTDLTAGYRGRAITRIATLAIGPGQAAVLGGRSGAGKTTGLLAIAGLADRLRGTVCLAGEDIGRLSPRARDRHRGASIGIIFQDIHLVSGLTAIDNMLLAPFAAGVVPDHRRAAALLDKLGIGTRASARAETLSRGEAQRIAIARAMLMSPRLILADEPTASLDDEAADAVIGLLLDATRDTDAALLVATHDARVRSRIARHIQVEPAR